MLFGAGGGEENAMDGNAMDAIDAMGAGGGARGQSRENAMDGKSGMGFSFIRSAFRAQAGTLHNRNCIFS